MSPVILTKLKLQSINYVYLHDRASNNIKGGVIRLGYVYVCDVTHDEILDTIFSREELHYDKFILRGEVESSDNDSECNEN